MEFKEALKNRRSHYALGKTSSISNEKIAELVSYAVKHTPSAFNSQSQMVAILFGEKHDRLWDIVMETLRKIVPEGHFASTEEKVNGFKGGYGTVLYFNDETITQNLQKAFPLYADSFPVWAEQAGGMLQLAVWSMLEAEGLGANLQHYNPLIDDAVHAAFDLPQNWRLMGQMPFGVVTAQPDEKDFADTAARVKILA